MRLCVLLIVEPNIVLLGSMQCVGGACANGLMVELSAR
jgi:hypothetical protein